MVRRLSFCALALTGACALVANVFIACASAYDAEPQEDASSSAESSAPDVQPGADDASNGNIDGSDTSDGADTGCSPDLTKDDKNCGACGRVCDLAGCAAGVCPVTKIADAMSVSAFASDGNALYWTEDNDGRVMRYVLLTKQLIPLAVGEPSPNAISVDANNVYWATHDYPKQPSDQTSSRVRSIGKAGGAVTDYGTTSLPTQLVLHGGRVYWLNRNGGSIVSCPAGVAGCTPQALLVGLNTPSSIATLDGILLYTEQGASSVKTCALPAGGSQQTLALTQSYPGGALLDGTRAYWHDLSFGAVMSAPRDGSGQPAALAPQAAAGSIATDGISLYWLDYQFPAGTYSIYRCPVAGCNGKPLLLARSSFFRGLIVDSSYVYFQQRDGAGNGLVARLPK
jgi:hypothetical protein